MRLLPSFRGFPALAAAVAGVASADPLPRSADALVDLPPDHPARREAAPADGAESAADLWIRLPVLLVPSPAPDDQDLKPEPDSKRATYHEMMSLGYRAYLDRRWKRAADFFAHAAEASASFGEKEYFAQENLGDTLRVAGYHAEAAYAYQRALDAVLAQADKGTKDIEDRLRRKLALLPDGAIASARAYTPETIREPSPPPPDMPRRREDLPELAAERGRRARELDHWELVHPYEDRYDELEGEGGLFKFTDPFIRFNEARLLACVGVAFYSKDIAIQNGLAYGAKFTLPMAFSWSHLYFQGLTTDAERTNDIPAGFDDSGSVLIGRGGLGIRLFGKGLFTSYLEVGGAYVRFTEVKELKSGLGASVGLDLDFRVWKMVHVDFNPTVDFSKSDHIILLTFGAGVEF